MHNSFLQPTSDLMELTITHLAYMNLPRSYSTYTIIHKLTACTCVQSINLLCDILFTGNYWPFRHMTAARLNLDYRSSGFLQTDN